MNHMSKPTGAPPEIPGSEVTTQSIQQRSTHQVSSDIDLTSVLGETTTYQSLLLAHCMLAMMLFSMNDQWPLVVAPEQDHWCSPPEHMNISTEAWKNMSIPIQEDGTYSQCEMYQEHNSSRPNRSTIRCTKWQYDETRHTGTVTQEWDTICGLEWMHSSALAIHMGSALLGLVASGILSDRLVEESPRWLISKWELQRAEDAVLAIAKVNGRSIEHARESWRNYKTLVKQGEGIICGVLDVSYTKILLQHKLLHANIILSYAWFATSFTFYGMTLVATAEKDLHWAVSLCILIPRQYIAYLCVEQFGRRPTLSYSVLMTSGASVAASFITAGDETLHYVKMTLRTLALSSIGVSVTVVLLYMVEMNPTSVRTISVCICCVFCRVGGILSVLVGKLDIVSGEVTQTALYAVACIVAGFLVTGLPETRMVILPEVTKKQDIFRIEPLRVAKVSKRRLEETTKSVTPVEERSLGEFPFSSERASRMSYLKDISSAL
ncbi:solute carrier family 22 member 2-like isoform X3 [Ornithodoros turicata]|uniref:solute carrier family 22 member 2-like isoform X3 n=1 Tax=Ornithodoros turicata TaxID=34597 RepID=UPI003138E0F9